MKKFKRWFRLMWGDKNIQYFILPLTGFLGTIFFPEIFSYYTNIKFYFFLMFFFVFIMSIISYFGFYRFWVEYNKCYKIKNLANNEYIQFIDNNATVEYTIYIENARLYNKFEVKIIKNKILKGVELKIIIVSEEILSKIKK